jgi:hypothetical protein
MKMPGLYKLKHDAFAQNVAAGIEIKDAYEQAGYVRRRGNPNRLARRPHVAARIEELRSQIHPDDIVNTQRVHARLLLAELLRSAGNRDAAARIANDLRQLALAIDQQAGIEVLTGRPRAGGADG